MTYPTMERAEDAGRAIWRGGRRNLHLLLVRDRLGRYALRQATATALRLDALKPGDVALRVWRPWSVDERIRWRL